MLDLSKFSALLIDDLPEMRTTVRIQLADCGLKKCDMARNIKEAVEKISAARFDLIVCDYNLGQGADGQQLLELVRRRKVLPFSTAFLMITGETGYEQVSTAAEYTPDDYLIKPFTSKTLQSRLERIIDRKSALQPIYQYLGDRGSDKQKALAACNALLAEKSRYAPEVNRIKGDLLVDLQRNDEALALYQAVLTERSTPWAEVGKARVLIAQGQDDKAKQHLTRTLQAYPNYLEAYDLMIGIMEKSDKPGAQRMVEKALKIAPTTQRHRQLGGIALENEDFERAEEAFNRAVEKDRTGFFKAFEDFTGLAKSRIEQGKVDAALATVKEMNKSFTPSPELTVRQAAAECYVHGRAGNAPAAKAALERTMVAKNKAELDVSAQLEIAQACFAAGEPDQAKEILQGIAEDHHENESVLAKAQSVFRVAGLGGEGEVFLAATKKRMIKLNNDAVAMAQSGDLDKAYAMLEEAANRLPNNAQVAINTAIAALMRAQRQGMKFEHFNQAHHYITQAHHANPDHPRLGDAIKLYRKLAPEDALTLLV